MLKLMLKMNDNKETMCLVDKKVKKEMHGKTKDDIEVASITMLHNIT